MIPFDKVMTLNCFNVEPIFSGPSTHGLIQVYTDDEKEKIYMFLRSGTESDLETPDSDDAYLSRYVERSVARALMDRASQSLPVADWGQYREGAGIDGMNMSGELLCIEFPARENSYGAYGKAADQYQSIVTSDRFKKLNEAAATDLGNKVNELISHNKQVLHQIH